MSAGKGFGTSPMGFNKNEVNEYIATLSKRISELETEKKELEKKYDSVKKVIDGADDRVKRAEDDAKEKIEKLEAQIKTERRNNEGLIDQVDELKRKLKNAGFAAAAGNSGNFSAVEKEAAEIISAAEKTARETVSEANKTAEEVVAKAKQTAAEIMQSTGGSGVDLSGFMAQLQSFVDSVNAGCKALSDKASEISNGSGGSSIEIPDFSAFTAPKADVPKESKTEIDFGMDFGASSESDTSSGIDEINALLESMAGGNSDSADDMSGDNMDGGFGFGEEAEEVAEEKTEEPEASISVTDLIMEAAEAAEKPAEDISFGEDIAAEDNGAELTADLSSIVEADEVKPEGKGLDFDMGENDEMDEMQKLLEQAEATFGGGSSEFEEKTADVSEDAQSSDDWSNLQNELDALEKQNTGLAGDIDMSADDDMNDVSDGSDGSDIWSLGNIEMSESDDDDMSSDLFGSF